MPHKTGYGGSSGAAAKPLPEGQFSGLLYGPQAARLSFADTLTVRLQESKTGQSASRQAKAGGPFSFLRKQAGQALRRSDHRMRQRRLPLLEIVFSTPLPPTTAPCLPGFPFARTASSLRHSMSLAPLILPAIPLT